MRAWLGPWVWETVIGPAPHWRMPNGGLGCLDLRSLSAQATPAVVLGRGLFLTDDSTDLGSAYREVQPTLNAARRNAIQAFLGLPDSVTALTRAGLILDLLTRHSRPTGDTFARPLMPQHDGRMRVRLGEADFEHQLDPASPYWSKIQRVYQEDYRRIRQDALDGKMRGVDGQPASDFHRKWLGHLVRRKHLGFDWRLFIPSDLPVEEPLDPTTTITDNFNRANSSTLGTSSEGWSWTEQEDPDGLEILNNQARLSTTGDKTARADSDLDSDDHYGQILIAARTIVSALAGHGPTARHSASALTFYLFHVQSNDANEKLYKRVTGTFTALTADASITQSIPDTMRIDCDGSILTGDYNGVDIFGNVTDTAITGNLRCGFYGGITGASNTIDIDDFEAADLAVAVGVPYQPWLQRGPVLAQ